MNGSRKVEAALMMNTALVESFTASVADSLPKIDVSMPRKRINTRPKNRYQKLANQFRRSIKKFNFQRENSLTLLFIHFAVEYHTEHKTRRAPSNKWRFPQKLNFASTLALFWAKRQLYRFICYCLLNFLFERKTFNSIISVFFPFTEIAHDPQTFLQSR